MRSKQRQYILLSDYGLWLTFPMAALTKTSVRGLSVAGIAGSNPAAVIDVYLL
jgi:hypothetical protein